VIQVRKAGLPDLSALCAFGKEQHARSNYAECAPFNAVMTRQFFKGAMTAPDHGFYVATDGTIRGLLLGHISTYPFSHVIYATDVLFVAEAGGDLLLDAFTAWARRRGARIMESAPSQSDRFDSLSRLYERKGFVRCGGTFRLMLQEVACPR
jgi:hypothetical protein